MAPTPWRWRLISHENQKSLWVGDGHLHRLDIEWKYTAATIAEAVSLKELLGNYGIFHSRSTCVRIDPKKAEYLTNNMPNNANILGKRPKIDLL
jgi:hypothetical protein